MSTNQLRVLNSEIQKLNGIIDRKISEGHNYKKEALRHKELLGEIRKEELRKAFSPFFQTFKLS
jgi:hypothetical protein